MTYLLSHKKNRQEQTTNTEVVFRHLNKAVLARTAVSTLDMHPHGCPLK